MNKLFYSSLVPSFSSGYCGILSGWSVFYRASRFSRFIFRKIERASSLQDGFNGLS